MREGARLSSTLGLKQKLPPLSIAQHSLSNVLIVKAELSAFTNASITVIQLGVYGLDVQDVNGFYQLLLNENSCPQGFSIGGCANFPSPPPVPCADVLRNGDVNQNSELDRKSMSQVLGL